ncbi:MAG TPA: acetyl-CoA carboxylase biotin carboxylase subunit, partial [Spirochaetia bacterium]|nr:acetyl-CoA carboxylase biotin carboxylase subunit [Spirochaetia bacterium]
IISASGGELTVKDDSRFPHGWSMECRINAKAPGTVLSYLPPGGREVRVDSFLYPGYRVPPYYDALLAKVITHGKDRSECIARMDRALSEFFLEGIETNLSSQRAIIESQLFKSGTYGTDILSRLAKE